MTASNKSTQYWLVPLKVLVLVLAFGYLYTKINNEIGAFFPLLQASFAKFGYGMLLIFILLATLNWVFEITKWKTLVNTLAPISFSVAAKQSLGSLTASIITPNRIGEYGAKALYFSSEKRKKILFLNFVHNVAQLFTTLLFGIPALVYVLWRYHVSIATNNVLLLVGFLLAALGIGFIFRKKQLGVNGLSLSNLWKHFKHISMGTKARVLALSILRYATFSSLFYVILWFFGTTPSYLTSAPLIFCMYLLVSVVPTFFIADVVIRGSVAVWLFSFLGIPELAVLTTVFMMWLLNVVLPASIGSYFVLTFKSSTA